MARPTKQAEIRFNYADRTAKVASEFLEKSPLTAADSQLGAYNTAVAVAHAAKGLGERAIGLRATYILQEEVKTLIER